ncbi:LOB domain-containing-like protein [Hibiscus syriacus]|uniref:LOB domain-containing-like protein n=1 Tax=Hibiscus syriacus TaxID=106335 RepID=A0A6A3AKA7_HIBSY|nr:LOB domain-containing-like protein [Hibiscus syriacus]
MTPHNPCTRFLGTLNHQATTPRQQLNPGDLGIEWKQPPNSPISTCNRSQSDHQLPFNENGSQDMFIYQVLNEVNAHGPGINNLRQFHVSQRNQIAVTMLEPARNHGGENQKKNNGLDGKGDDLMLKRNGEACSHSRTQPALDPEKLELHHPIFARDKNSTVPGGRTSPITGNASTNDTLIPLFGCLLCLK